VEAGGNGGFGFVGGEMDRLADAYLEGTRAKPAIFAGFEFSQALNSHGQDGCLRLLYQEADSWAERGESAFFRTGSFGEDYDMEAIVERVAGVGEAALEVAKAREGKDVEEGGEEEPGGWPERVEPARLLVAGMAEVFEHLTRHGDGGVEANGAGKRVEEERKIVGGDVVGDDEEWFCWLGVR